MAPETVNETQILDELHHVPAPRWGEILAFIRSLQGAGTEMTASDLVQSPLVGMWADRTDIGDSQSFARRLREQAEHRRGGRDAPGH